MKLGHLRRSNDVSSIFKLAAEFKGSTETSYIAYLATGQIKDVFAHFRNLRVACPRKVTPILGDHGNLISDKAAKAHRWKNHFEQLLNHPSVSCPVLPSTVQEDQQACQEPSHSEVHTAVRKLNYGKAPGLCGITTDMLKASGHHGILWLTNMIKQVWQTGVIPPDWKKGIILPIYNGKGSPKDCKNYIVTSLVSTHRNVFATFLLNKVRDQLLAHRRVEQSGFTLGRSTIDRTLSSKVGKSFRSLFGLLSLN